MNAGVDLKRLQKDMYDLWAKACVKAGLRKPSRKHGVDIKSHAYTMDYITKYGKGADYEMTHGHTKNGKDGGETPFDLLRAYTENGDQEAGRLFREFVEVFTKGKRRQLFWSPGLKKHFGIGEKSDEQIAAEQDDPSELVGVIKRPQWRAVVHFKVRGEILDFARTREWDRAQALIVEMFEAYERIGRPRPDG
jgi:hypothetical protein